MNSKEYSRSEFLRTFAVLSSAPLLASMLAGCGSSESLPPNLYGPGPVNVTVGRMVFLDAQSNQVALSENQSVPVHTSILIQFSGPMNAASVVAAITFANTNNAPVAFGTNWDQYDVNATITPSADLAPGTNYTLAVSGSATDSNGRGLTVNANSSASFKTAT
jgi:Bacterial Ig-like domain